MNRVRLSIAVVLMGLLFVAGVPSQAQSGRQVWAFYMGFWTGNGWGSSPEVMDDQPAIGLYDSRDPGVAGMQIDQAKSAGIDAFVVSWFGPSDGAVTTAVFNTLLDQAGARGFMVGAAIDIYDPNFNNARDSIVNAANYLVHDRANHPAYLRYNGKPVIFFAFQNRVGFSAAQWQEIRNAVDPNHNTIWIAEGVTGCCIYGGAMDGMYAFNLAWANGSSSRYRTERNRALGAGGSMYIPTIHPGWNESKIAAREGRRNPTAPRNRADGRFLTTSFNGAVASGADVILVGTWNEYVENSHIEPSVNFGTQSLDILRPLIQTWKTGAPSNAGGGQTTNTAPANTEFAPGTQVVVATQGVNVRAGASTTHQILGRLTRGTALQLVGQEGDWYIVIYNGQNAYVSAQFSRIEQR